MYFPIVACTKYKKEEQTLTVTMDPSILPLTTQSLTHLIISNSLWSDTLMLRAMFQERCTMGTIDLTLWSLFHSYRSTASLY